jgi:hypothetical protein
MDIIFKAGRMTLNNVYENSHGGGKGEGDALYWIPVPVFNIGRKLKTKGYI